MRRIAPRGAWRSNRADTDKRSVSALGPVTAVPIGSPERATDGKISLRPALSERAGNLGQEAAKVTSRPASRQV
ncbi:hypothetical protein SAMN04487819_10247 [Actinopolyspora alba]|uniref:Uncharacterized protein n=1 Tax=Actinopolyspora alba TaxID=673379 RepID=A0A1I1UB20_9ACTN|nr:hypothetical protein SAMN04487819_10247 [Actinopolyspora alba]